MTRLTRLCRALGVGLAVAAATLSVTGVAQAGPTAPTVPANIAVPAGNKVFLVAKVSTGVQIYKCNGTAWVFDHPEATLVGDNGKEIIKHFAGPTWKAKDGSQVVAARVDGATPDPTAIPWLLLKKTSTAAGPDGDRLVHTTFIQRVNTSGGLAPTKLCDTSVLNQEERVSYQADYYFYKATGGA